MHVPGQAASSIAGSPDTARRFGFRVRSPGTGLKGLLGTSSAPLSPHRLIQAEAQSASSRNGSGRSVMYTTGAHHPAGPLAASGGRNERFFRAAARVGNIKWDARTPGTSPAGLTATRLSPAGSGKSVTPPLVSQCQPLPPRRGSLGLVCPRTQMPETLGG